MSAQKLGLKATIVMPNTTPAIKVKAVKGFGATVVLNGDNYSEAAEYCKKLTQETGATYIHPFDDPLVIAGQGTVGYEILQQCANVEYIFVPVGGGGLIAGIAAYIKQLIPEIKIIGVEPDDSNAMTLSIKKKERVLLDQVGIFADGVAVKQVGELTYQLCQQFVDDWVVVSTDETCEAIKAIYEDTRSIVEPAGGLALAGATKYIGEQQIQGKKIVCINSGANMNFDRLRFIAERTNTGETKDAIFAITMPEKAGTLRQLCTHVLGNRNLTEFNYRLLSREQAHIFAGVSLDKDHGKADFIEKLEKNNFKYLDLSHNELAKVHIRYMVGGRAELAENERIFRFQFPERLGALIDFLSKMSGNWNISMFHYRNQGGNFGRVLMGFEVKPEDGERFIQHLEQIGYTYFEETQNPAYHLFL